MSDGSAGPGPSSTEHKLWIVQVGQWAWGTVEGAFNEKQTLSQIIVDAVIGMIPVVGDVTAARDLIAVGISLGTNPEKRAKVGEWVLLAILIFALIPVAGGAIKGVSRIALRVTEDAARDGRAIAEIAGEIIQFLNRIGHKNAELWFKALDVLSYEGKIVEKCRAFCDTVIISINRYVIRFKEVLPQSLISRAEQISDAFRQIKNLADKMIPEALKDLNERLQKLQSYIHAGGVPPPSKALMQEAQTGQKTVTYAEEARLVEDGAKNIVHAGKFPQNFASTEGAGRAEIAKIYKHEPGYPDLFVGVGKDEETGTSFYEKIAASSGPIKNEELSGVTLFRAFGDGNSTHGVMVNKTNPVGLWWGIGEAPKTAKEWREKSAVLDEFNRNGKISIVRIPENVKVKACTGTVSEQFSKKIPGQYLEGGGKQAAITEFFGSEIEKTIKDLYAKGGGKATLPNGVVVEVRDSGWSKINGKIGYGQTVIPGAAMTERLGVTELQTKMGVAAAQQTASQQAAIATAKQRRSQQGP